MRLPNPTTVDFETHGIEGRPDYPPVPVGVSIKKWGKRAHYYAWGHLSGEHTCDQATAVRALKEAYATPDGVLFQNAKFDVDVANHHLGLPILPWQKIHDSMFLIYLEDPRRTTFSLKPSAEHFLDMPPEEQDAVKAWILDKDNKKWIESHLGLDANDKQITVKPSEFGKYICYAPASVVGPYANGDTDRTEKLFRKLWASIVKRGMKDAYDRERRLMPHLLQSERQGIRLDVKRLSKDVDDYTKVLESIDALIRKKCRSQRLNVDSNADLADAMIAAGLADEGLMGYTKTGKVSTNKDAIREGVTDPEMKALMSYRGPLTTCMKTFMMPWLATASRSDGLLFTNWNQVKQGDGKNRVGTSTGRLSSTPNFQNIPKEFAQLVKLLQFLTLRPNPKPREVQASKVKLAALEKKLRLAKGLPPLPLCRSYVVPYTPDHVLLDRDYSQQELRLLGYYEGGPLYDSYMEDVWLDVHDKTRILILEIVGMEYERTPVKNTNFGIIYGQGASSLAVKNNISIEESKQLYKAILEVFPGIGELQEDMKDRAKHDEPIRTWGGREYFCEPDQYIEKFKRVMSFDYKLLNLLIQGGAADATKEAAIRYCDAKPADDYFMLNVHDQFTSSAPKTRMHQSMLLMRDCMESLEIEIPLKTEGKWSDKNWASLVDYDKAGVTVYKGKY